MKVRLKAEADNPYRDLDCSQISQKQVFYTLNEKKGSHVFASSLTGSNTRGMNLT